MLQSVGKDLQQGDIVEALFIPLFARTSMDFVQVSEDQCVRVVRDLSPDVSDLQHGLCTVPAIKRRAMILSAKPAADDPAALLVAPLFRFTERIQFERMGLNGVSQKVEWSEATTDE